MRSAVAVAVLVLSTHAGGCKGREDAPTAARDAAPTSASAERWVDGRCQCAFPCPGCDLAFDEKVHEFRESTELQCRFKAECTVTAEAGRCGDYRYVHHHDAYGRETVYFTQDGKPLAAHRELSAQVFCDGRANACDYGPVPSCAPVLTDDLVPASPTPRFGARDGGAR